MNSGKLLIVLIIAVAVAAGAVAWRVQANRGVRVLELWGSENAYLIRCADSVKLLCTGQEVEVNNAPGIAHARQALIVDASYDWTADSSRRGADIPLWTHELLFGAEDGQFLLKLDLEQRLAESGDGRRVRMGQTLANGLRLFLTEQLSQESN